jgi:dTDP-4-amino-4,6-dideoxygalactose transaminase
MANERIYLSPPHMSGKELEFVRQAFASNWIAPVGPDIDAFERDVCNFIGAKHAVAVSSGTAALHLALQLCGVGEGDVVACSTFTFAGSAFPITYCKAIPVFIDSERQSWNMDPNLFEDAVKAWVKKGKPIKAVIVVHLYGQAADLDPINEICKRHKIVLIEDAAESLGATYKGKHTGTFGAMGIFSFNGNKIVTTSGGGMLVSDDGSIVEKARFLATQARDPFPHYEHSHVGYNYRLSNICAAIGRAQLDMLNNKTDLKRRIFDYYHRELSPMPGISFMPEASYGKSNRWLTCITVDQRLFGTTGEKIRLALERENIESRPLWKPMHLQPVFKHYPAFITGVSQDLFEKGLCLPSGTQLSDEDLERIVRCMLADHC